MKKILFSAVLCLALASCNTNSSSTEAIANTPAPLRFTEIQTYQLKPGVQLDEFLSAANNVNGFLDAQPGFIDRVLSVSDSGIVEVAHWKDAAAFAAAQAKAFEDDRALFFFGFIEETSLKPYFGKENLVHSNAK